MICDAAVMSTGGPAPFADALRRARYQGFSATDDLRDALGEYVHFLREHGSSCEDAITAVGAQVRSISPRDPPSGQRWEDRWRRYFTLYDALIEQTIRAYVLDEVSNPTVRSADCNSFA
jgi:hypothetical protein